MFRLCGFDGGGDHGTDLPSAARTAEVGHHQNNTAGKISSEVHYMSRETIKVKPLVTNHTRGLGSLFYRGKR